MFLFMRPIAAVTLLTILILFAALVADYGLAARISIGILAPFAIVVLTLGVLWAIEAVLDWRRFVASARNGVGRAFTTAIRLEIRTDILGTVVHTALFVLLLLAGWNIYQRAETIRVRLALDTERVIPAANVRVLDARHGSHNPFAASPDWVTTSGRVNRVHYRIPAHRGKSRIVFAQAAGGVGRDNKPATWSHAVTVEVPRAACSSKGATNLRCSVLVEPLSTTLLRTAQFLGSSMDSDSVVTVILSDVEWRTPPLTAVPVKEGWLLRPERRSELKPSAADPPPSRDSVADSAKLLEVSGGKTKLHVVVTPTDAKLSVFRRQEEIRVEDSPQLLYVGPELKPHHAGWGRREISFVPLGADSVSGVVSVALHDGTGLAGLLCKGAGCSETSVEVRALQRGSFLEANHVKGAANATVNKFREQETATWALTDPRRGVYFTYWTPTFRPYRWILDPFAYVSSLSEVIHILFGFGLGGLLITTLLSLLWRLFPESAKRYLRRMPVVGGIVKKWERDEMLPDSD